MDCLLNRAALKANIHFLEESLSKVSTYEPAVLCFLPADFSASFFIYFLFNLVVIMSLKEGPAQTGQRPVTDTEGRAKSSSDKAGAFFF